MTEDQEVRFVDPESVSSKIPKFEGSDVSGTKAKLTSVGALDVKDGVFMLDDMVRLVVECRVVRVDHAVNQTSGLLERVHTFKALEADIIPWHVEIAREEINGGDFS